MEVQWSAWYENIRALGVYTWKKLCPVTGQISSLNRSYGAVTYGAVTAFGMLSLTLVVNNFSGYDPHTCIEVQWSVYVTF